MQTSFVIDRKPLGQRVGKVDMTKGYMKYDIRYLTFHLSRLMGLLAMGHLQTWMVHFIETIRIAKIHINWATILRVD